MSSNQLKARRRSDYVYFLTYRTHWSDNDMYLHMNNSIYYQLFDLIMNTYLIERCGFTPPSSPLIGLVISSHCQVRYSKPSSDLLISMIAMIVFFRFSDSLKSLTLAWGWINWGRARWYTKWALSKKKKTHLQPLVDMPKSSSRANRGRAQPLDRKPEMICRSCLHHRPNYKQVSKHSFLLTIIINTRRKSNSCAVSIIIRGIPWNTRLWAPATLYVKKTHRTSKTRLLRGNPVNHKPHHMHYSRTYDRKVWLKIFA